jgi:hypothetical protein
VDDGSRPPSNESAGIAIAFALEATVPTSPGSTTRRVVSRAAIPLDGAFDLLLPEGEYDISFRNIPLGYDVRALTSGNIDLQATRLNVGTTSNLGVIRASLTKASVRGVSVSGRVTGLKTATISLLSASSASRSTSTDIQPDGTFAFPSVPPGAYSVYAAADLQGPPTALTPPAWWIQVGNENLRDIEFYGLVVQNTGDGPFRGNPPQDNAPQITGRVLAVDDAGNAQSVPSGVMIRLSSHLTAVRPDGTFSLPIRNGEHMIALSGLPAGYGIRSMTRGGVKLLSTPLRVDANTGSSEEIRVTLELNRRDAAEGRNRIVNGSISGQLQNTDGSPAANIPIRAALGALAPGVAATITDSGGNYRLENLPPNQYLLITGEGPVGPTQVSRVVGRGAGPNGAALPVSIGYGMNVDLGPAVGTTTAARGGRGGPVTIYTLQR